MADAPAKQSRRILAKTLSGVVVLALAVVILSNAASQFLADKSPRMAIRLNPLNSTARIVEVYRGLQNLDQNETTAQLKRRSEDLIAVAPLNATGFALLGQVHAIEGDLVQADALFDHALEISDANILALQWGVQRAINSGAFDVGADLLYRIALRWPDQWANVMPSAAVMLSDSDGLAMVAERFHDDTQQRVRLLNGLRTTGENDVLASQLILKLHQNKAPNLGSEISSTITDLLRGDQVSAAQNLFLFTLDADEQSHLGYVFNGGFADLDAKGQFNWNLNTKAGLSVAYGEETGDGLRLDFLNAPSIVNTARQTLVLHAGTYELSVRTSANELELASPLAFTIRCVDAPATPLVTLPLADGTHINEVATAAFSVQGDGCGTQVIQLSNNVVELDWKTRNAGRLTVHNVAIQQVEKP